MAAGHALEADATDAARCAWCRASAAGVDNVWPYLPDGVTLCNAAGVHDASTAELAVGLDPRAACAASTSSPAPRRRGSGATQRHDSLADKRVLVLGSGHVGQAIERRLAPFEVEIVRVARTARTLDDGRSCTATDELPDLLPDADVVVLIVPATPETIGLVDAAFLARMQPGALLVNVARGAVVRTDDLVRRCTPGTCAPRSTSPTPSRCPPTTRCGRAPGVLISPHVGGYTHGLPPARPPARRRSSCAAGAWATPSRT